MENIKKLKVKDSIKVKKKLDEKIEAITEDNINKDVKEDAIKEVETSECDKCKYTRGVPSCKNCIFNK